MRAGFFAGINLIVVFLAPKIRAEQPTRRKGLLTPSLGLFPPIPSKIDDFHPVVDLRVFGGRAFGHNDDITGKPMS